MEGSVQRGTLVLLDLHVDEYIFDQNEEFFGCVCYRHVNGISVRERKCGISRVVCVAHTYLQYTFPCIHQKLVIISL